MGRSRMKWTVVILTVVLLVFVVYLYPVTRVPAGSEAELTFRYGAQEIRATLTREESEKIVEILDGNGYDLFTGVPSCGFDGDISLSVNGRTYAIACDGCGMIQDLGNLRFFAVTEEEMAYIHALFEQYGGSFPCI